MNTYWAFVQTVVGGFMRVTVQAPNPYQAQQQLQAQYNEKLLSYPAMCTENSL